MKVKHLCALLLFGFLAIWIIILAKDTNTDEEIEYELALPSFTLPDPDAKPLVHQFFVPPFWDGIPLWQDNQLYKSPQTVNLAGLDSVLPLLFAQSARLVTLTTDYGMNNVFERIESDWNLYVKDKIIAQQIAFQLGSAILDLAEIEEAIQVSARPLLDFAFLDGVLFNYLSSNSAILYDLQNLIPNKVCYFEDDNPEIWMVCNERVGRSLYLLKDLDSAIEGCSFVSTKLEAQYSCAYGAYAKVANIFAIECELQRYAAPCYLAQWQATEPKTLTPNVKIPILNCDSQSTKFKECLFGKAYMRKGTMQSPSTKTTCDAYKPAFPIEDTPEWNLFAACVEGLLLGHPTNQFFNPGDILTFCEQFPAESQLRDFCFKTGEKKFHPATIPWNPKIFS